MQTENPMSLEAEGWEAAAKTAYDLALRFCRSGMMWRQGGDSHLADDMVTEDFTKAAQLLSAASCFQMQGQVCRQSTGIIQPTKGMLQQ